MMQDYGSEYAELMFYNPTESDRRTGLWPLRAGRNLAKPHYCAGPKTIDGYSLHFVMDGAVTFAWADRRVELQQGDLFCLFPHVRYEFAPFGSPETPPLRTCWIAFDGVEAEGLLASSGITEDTPYAEQVLSLELERQLARTLAGFTQADKPGGGLKLIGCLYAIFGELQSTHSVKLESEKEDWIARSVEFMRLHCCERITVEEVAHAAGIHRSYYSTKFAERIGMPPVKYMQKLRMDRAALLLSETELPITEIALTVGYPELYAFTRFFTHFYGMSPSKYRSGKKRRERDRVERL